MVRLRTTEPKGKGSNPLGAHTKGLRIAGLASLLPTQGPQRCAESAALPSAAPLAQGSEVVVAPLGGAERSRRVGQRADSRVEFKATAVMARARSRRGSRGRIAR